jgi:cell fate regulator YaaT (PSP1 superfamily)
MGNRTMSNEFDSLDAKKATLKGALIRCRALVGRIEGELCNKKPEHFDEQTLADFYASVERAAGILRQKGR